MKSTLPGAMRPDRSALPLMPMAAKRRLRQDRAVLVDQPDIAQAEQHARSIGRALEDGVVDLYANVGKLAVDRRFDGGNEALQRNRATAEPSIAEHDGHQADDENAGEDFTADMRAARRTIS